jgi:glycolate oxidase
MQRTVLDIGKRHGLSMLTLGHAGDGNIHPIILYDRSDPAQAAAMEEADDEVVATALALGGTITGEHGVGSEKRRQMRQRFTPAEIAAMHAVRAAFDPDGLLNPGILLPDADSTDPSLPRFAARMREIVSARRAGRQWSPGSTAPSVAGDAGVNIALDGENLTVMASASTSLAALHAMLAARGFRCLLPTGDATLGATITSDDTHRAVVRDTLLAVRTLLPDGQPARFGSNAVKDVAGYDMKRLFIGSHDVFGSLYEVTLRILPTRHTN